MGGKSETLEHMIHDKHTKYITAKPISLQSVIQTTLFQVVCNFSHNLLEFHMFHRSLVLLQQTVLQKQADTTKVK